MSIYCPTFPGVSESSGVAACEKRPAVLGGGDQAGVVGGEKRRRKRD